MFVTVKAVRKNNIAKLFPNCEFFQPIRAGFEQI